MKKFISIILSIMIMFTITSCSTPKKKATNFNHAFSVSEFKQVYFAKSNLQYCPAKDKWTFAENAYDTIGKDNENISETYDGYIDLFGWGATGYKNVLPTKTETNNTAYGMGHKNIANTNFDFGVYLSDKIGKGWRMFTHNEIHYLLMYRKNAQKLFGYGTINNIKGLFILPDDWVAPRGIKFEPSVSKGFENQYNWYYTIGDNENYNYNNFTESEWYLMKSSGAVFLPVTGMRYNTECSHVGISGHYWTSSYYGEEFANCLCLFEKDLFLEGNFDRSYGLAIRLVKDAQ